MPSPLLLSTWSFGRRANAAAWPALDAGGSSLDAIVAACDESEGDPEVDSVGYGGLPDRDGNMTLDACVMRSPRERGSVCAMRHTRHPAAVARCVMETTPHVLLAGAGADTFAREQGFAVEAPEALVAPAARHAWEQWRRDPKAVDQSRDAATARPVDRAGSGRLFGDAGRARGAGLGDAPDQGAADEAEARWRHHDTLGVLALDAGGVLAGGCTTSGTPYKLPGRVGDSPIVGHGLYVDPDAGACVATGTGELMMGLCTSFFVVERMRSGATPEDAVRAALERIAAAYALVPADQCGLIAVRPDGTFATAALRTGYRTAVRSRDRDAVVDPDLILLAD